MEEGKELSASGKTYKWAVEGWPNGKKKKKELTNLLQSQEMSTSFIRRFNHFLAVLFYTESNLSLYSLSKNSLNVASLEIGSPISIARSIHPRQQHWHVQRDNNKGVILAFTTVSTVHQLLNCQWQVWNKKGTSKINVNQRAEVETKGHFERHWIVRQRSAGQENNKKENTNVYKQSLSLITCCRCCCCKVGKRHNNNLRKSITVCAVRDYRTWTVFFPAVSYRLVVS